MGQDTDGGSSGGGPIPQERLNSNPVVPSPRELASGRLSAVIAGSQFQAGVGQKHDIQYYDDHRDDVARNR